MKLILTQLATKFKLRRTDEIQTLQEIILFDEEIINYLFDYPSIAEAIQKYLNDHELNNKIEHFAFDDEFEDKFKYQTGAMLLFWWMVFHGLKKKKKIQNELEPELKLNFKSVEELHSYSGNTTSTPTNKTSQPYTSTKPK